jgi:2-oxoglutarate/2-oxoacid ferredoxin oxidoreductase subunit beta
MSTPPSTAITQESLHSPYFPTWCPGCGNFGVWTALRNALTRLQIPEEQVTIVYGVGCSGNMADFNRVYGFHALHGRSIPTAIGIKLANHRLKVIAIAGDGDTYGEGMNHFLNLFRGNHDIALFVHDNTVYGLTTGQTAPTTQKGKKTKSTPAGAIEHPVNPLGLALTVNATFVARGFSGQVDHLSQLMEAAILHPGAALLDIFQPCFTFDKEKTYHYYRQLVYNLQAEGYQPTDARKAYDLTFEGDKLPLGIFYQDPTSVPFHASVAQLEKDTLVNQSIASLDLSSHIQGYL